MEVKKSGSRMRVGLFDCFARVFGIHGTARNSHGCDTVYDIARMLDPDWGAISQRLFNEKKNDRNIEDTGKIQCLTEITIACSGIPQNAQRMGLGRDGCAHGMESPCCWIEARWCDFVWACSILGVE